MGIKEILDYLQDKDNYIEELGVAYKRIHINNGDLKLLLDYITNLQQENQDLSRICELYGKSLYNAELTDYKSRIEKAVEYLDKHKIELSHSFDEPDCDYWIATNPQDIIDILNGRSDE